MRLDAFLTKNNYYESRNKAQWAIEHGEVSVSGRVVYKPSLKVDESVSITVNKNENFVSLGGFKMRKALNDFNFDVRNMVVADIGSSTGGFTDCLLKYGAKKVYAVDLNDRLLHNTLKSDDRVEEIIKNVKDVKKIDFENELDLVVADLSFISSSVFLPILSDIIGNEKYLILLIKPQFELDKKIRYKNGIIRNKNVHRTSINLVVDLAKKYNLKPLKITPAPEYEDKNREFLILLKKTNNLENLLFNVEVDKLFVK